MKVATLTGGLSFIMLVVAVLGVLIILYPTPTVFPDVTFGSSSVPTASYRHEVANPSERTFPLTLDQIKQGQVTFAGRLKGGDGGQEVEEAIREGQPITGAFTLGDICFSFKLYMTAPLRWRLNLWYSNRRPLDREDLCGLELDGVDPDWSVETDDGVLKALLNGEFPEMVGNVRGGEAVIAWVLQQIALALSP